MIPPVIHQIWVGVPMPEHLRELRATWRTLHPDWDLLLWTESQLDWLTNQHLFDRAEDYTAHVGQFRADVARLEILHRFGGVYVDCDMEALRPLGDLIVPSTSFFAGWETDGRWVNNAVMGAVPGHPLLAELIEALPAHVERRFREPRIRPNKLSGPQFITPRLVGRDDVTLFPAATFYPYRWDQLDRHGEDFPESVAVHHWENARKRQGVTRG